MLVWGNLKVQTGLRFDKLVFEGFKRLCKREKLMVGEAVQGLIGMCLEAGSVVDVLTARRVESRAGKKADELRLRGALAELRGFIRAVEAEKGWYVTVKDKETRIDRAVYRPAYDVALAMLLKVGDEQLLGEAEQVLRRANECVEKVIVE